MKGRNGFSLVALLVLALLCSMTWGCGQKSGGGAKPGVSPSPGSSPKAEAFSNTEVGYSVPYLEGWARPKDATVGEFFAVCEKAKNKPLPSFNIVSIEKEPYNLKDPKNQKEIKDEIEKDLKCVHEESLDVAGKPAYQIVFGLEKDKQMMIFKQTYLFNKKWLVVCTAACREEDFEKYNADFDKILQGMEFPK
jgi:hypothetical protein